MCIQDWQIGRLIRCIPRIITVTGTTSIILQRDKNRVAVTFCSDPDASWLALPQIPQASSRGFLIPARGASATSAMTGTITGNPGSAPIILSAVNPVVGSDYTGDVDPPAFSYPISMDYERFDSSPLGWYHFTTKDYGDLSMQQWSGVSLGGSITTTIIEYILPEDVLRMTPDELRAIA